MAKTVSPAGRAAIAAREGCVLHAYLDDVGVPTIGVGHTGRMSPPAVKLGDRIVQAEADRYLAADLAPVEAAIDRAVKVPIGQNQRDALASLAFNIGVGGFAGSTVVHKLNAGDVQGAADAFLMWDHPAELTARRRAERAQFLRPDGQAPEVKAPAHIDRAKAAAKPSLADRVKRHLGFLGLACAVLLAAGPALAGSPYAVDDPGLTTAVLQHQVAQLQDTVAALQVSPNAAFWAKVTATLMQGAAAIVTVIVGWAVVKARAWFGLQITATQEEQVRQALLTGAHAAIVRGEAAADGAHLIERSIAWAKERQAATIAKLGWSDQVLFNVAAKMASAALSAAVQPKASA